MCYFAGSKGSLSAIESFLGTCNLFLEVEFNEGPYAEIAKAILIFAFVLIEPL